MAGSGILALWKDCAEGKHQTFERWYQTEHISERLAVPGFLRCRRYEALDATSEYFTWYEVETPAVLRSDDYRERLENPTPLTTEVMSAIMKNMSRTACHRTVLAGDRFGAVAVTVKLGSEAPKLRDDLRNMAQDLTTNVTLARAELWIKDATDSVAAEEERLRGGDAKIGTCLLLEFLRTTAAEEATSIVRNSSTSAEVGIYQLLCEQTKVKL